MKATKKYNIEIIIPCYNEEKNINILYNKILEEVKKSKKIKEYKIVFVNDGSSDNTKEIISNLSKKDINVTYINKNRRQEKSEALQSGFNQIKSNTDLVFMMDADLQDDPKEFDNFIKKIEEGYDVVSGYKVNRLDNIEKRYASKLFNKTINFFFKMNLHDHNCGFKCFKKKVIKDININKDLHRFITVFLNDLGYNVGEVEVCHHKRKYGKSKYGISRYFIGLKDLIKVKIMLKKSKR